jgi:putative DNA methylase
MHPQPELRWAGMTHSLAPFPARFQSAGPRRSFLEADFPFEEVSVLARADRHRKDPVYSAHKWWARRPPVVMRALVLAAWLPADTTRERFWELFASDDPHLEGVHIGDPFAGGATTLVEAARLGARVTGIDVDPLAVRIARDELGESCRDDLAAAVPQLLGHLRRKRTGLYPAEGDATPLHYFWLRRVDCPDCSTSSLLYRDPVLVRDRGRSGAVVRDEAVVALCPDCRRLHHLASEVEFMCCGRTHSLTHGTYGRSGHRCPGCGTRRNHEELCSATLPRELIAVEETVAGGRRRLREPSARDRSAVDRACRETASIADALPAASLVDVDGGRPASYGFERLADLFTERQRVVIADAFRWIAEAELPTVVRRRLELGVSNALSCNNALCGYATDYGRLAPLFAGVRAYALPALAVELNPLHPDAGRGTFSAVLARLVRSSTRAVTRHVFDPRTGAPTLRELTARRLVAHRLLCQSADRAFPRDLGSCDLILTDPPYFDFIAYSDLSLLHRSWLWPEADDGGMGGRPIYPVGDDAAQEFSRRLGRAFGHARDALAPGGSITFTFHSTNPVAWEALRDALRAARLHVTSAFPVWADAPAVAHGHAGSCEWDLVLTCRRQTSPAPAVAGTLANWLERLADDSLSPNDIDSMRLGLAAARDVNGKRGRKP